MPILLRMCSISLVLICMLITGCGATVPMGTVKGNVTLNGNAYSDASVVFLSLQSGAASSSDIQTDGTFTLPDELPVGTYKVYLAPRSIPEDDAGEPMAVQMDNAVPQKYWSEATTDIEVQVNEGENSVAVDLKG